MPLYQLTPGDKAIFDKVLKTRNLNWFTNYYLRSDTSGTWWKPVKEELLEQIEVPEFMDMSLRWKSGYEVLFSRWNELGKPEFFAEIKPGQYEIISAEQYGEILDLRKYRTTSDPDNPSSGDIVFHHNHGFLFLPWQNDASQAPQEERVCVGGFGCISAETRIYDAELKEHVAVADLVAQQRAPLVMSWNGSDFVPIRATIPFLKGIKSLYRVTLHSGRSFVGTHDHVVLSQAGWSQTETLRCGEYLLTSGANHPQSNLEPDQQVSLRDVQHWTKTVRDSQGGYPHDYHLYDEQPHLAPEVAPVSLPLRSDAHEYNHAYLIAGEMACAEEYILTYQLHDLPSKPYFSRRVVPLAWHLEGYRDVSSDDELVQLALADSEALQFLGTYSSVPPAPGFDPDMDQEPKTSCGSPDSSLLESYYYTGIWDEIVDITYVGEGDYYDLHVPIYNNYLAEGIVHHNSGKTYGFMVEMLVYGAILPRFRAFGLAPFAVQANEVFVQAKGLIDGTLYAERFLIRAPRKPQPHLVIGNSLVGDNNTIECYPILEDTDKILTLSGDMAMVDQAEKMPDIYEARRMIGSRFRGMVGGRSRLGKIAYVANVADNPSLWDLYDEGETDPKGVWSFSPHSGLNSYLTIKDMIRYQKMVGKTEDERRMYFGGGRPMGSGEYFNRTMLDNARARWMDDLMQDNLQLETEGWKHVKAEKCGTVKWEMPPEEDGEYIVIADPGYKNPPYRDSAGVSVWKVNGFPFVPAHLVGFTWVAGNGNPEPWMNQYTDYVIRYRAIGHNGYDATGSGAAYAKLTDINELLPYPVNLGAMKKQSYITLLQTVMARGLLQMPYIEHIFSQLAKYEYPEKEKMRQDLVMMLLVAVAVLEPRWYLQFQTKNEKEYYDPSDRYSPTNTAPDRYQTLPR